MKMLLRLSMATLLLLVTVGGVRAERIQATLTGYEESPPVSTTASGEFRGLISRNEERHRL